MWALIILIFIVLIGIILAFYINNSSILGGKEAVKFPLNSNVLIDTLNIMHYLHPRQKVFSISDIGKAIHTLAPKLKEKFLGHAIFAIKDKDNQYNTKEIHDELQKIAVDNRVIIAIAEKYKELEMKKTSHSSYGRDDFYLIYMSNKEKFPIITRDQFRDLPDFKEHLSKFYVLEYNFWSPCPEKKYLNPEMVNIRKPFIINPNRVF